MRIWSNADDNTDDKADDTANERYVLPLIWLIYDHENVPLLDVNPLHCSNVICPSQIT